MENIIYLIVGFGVGYLYGKMKGMVWGLMRERASRVDKLFLDRGKIVVCK